MVAQKNYARAAEIYKELLKNYFEKSLKENIPLLLAVCYEEIKDFQTAIKTLEILVGKYTPPEYIELRIKRLKERLKNQPGAKGFRK